MHNTLFFFFSIFFSISTPIHLRVKGKITNEVAVHVISAGVFFHYHSSSCLVVDRKHSKLNMFQIKVRASMNCNTYINFISMKINSCIMQNYAKFKVKTADFLFVFPFCFFLYRCLDRKCRQNDCFAL